MKKTLMILGVFLTIALTGCETIKGIGRDIQNTGDNIQDIVTGEADTP